MRARVGRGWIVRLVMDDVRIDRAEHVMVSAAETVYDARADPNEAYGPWPPA